MAKYLVANKSHPFRLVVTKGSVADFSHPNGAIVNAANEGCLGGGGVDGAISTMGGNNLFQDRLALPILNYKGEVPVRCPVGEAKVTGPNPNYGSLRVPYVIHSVGPNYRNFDDSVKADELLQSAYTQSLDRAKECYIEAVAFSLLSAGVFRGKRSLESVLRIGIDTILQFDGYEQLKEVHLCGFNDSEVRTLFGITQSISTLKPLKEDHD